MLERRGSNIIQATLVSVVGVAILAALGIWQLERKAWKENIIATLNARLTHVPVVLPPPARWPQLTQANDEFRRVHFSAEFRHSEFALVYTAGSAFRPDVQGAGYWVFAPARLADGTIIVVNRGFLPHDRKDLAAATPTREPVRIAGVMRWPDRRGMFTPADEPRNNFWYLRDPRAISAAKKWNAGAPFYVEQEAPVPPGGWPKPGKLQVTLPNNHLQYAITWFGLALALAAVYAFWIADRLRGHRASFLVKGRRRG